MATASGVEHTRLTHLKKCKPLVVIYHNFKALIVNQSEETIVAKSILSHI